MSETTEATFEHSAGFEAGEIGGNLRHGKLEAMYEELFAEVIEDGIITQDERNQLDKMADSPCLDRARLRRLEQALQAAYEARNRVVIKDLSMDDAPPPATIMPLEPATDHRSMALERRIKFLEGRVATLERELEDARANISVEVVFSGSCFLAGSSFTSCLSRRSAERRPIKTAETTTAKISPTSGSSSGWKTRRRQASWVTEPLGRMSAASLCLP